MMHIIHRLLAAAADAKLRQDMNVEDEYFLAIENRDTAIMKRDKRIKEQDELLEEQGQKLEEQGQKLEEQGQKLEEQGQKLEEQGQKLEEKDNIIISSAKMMKANGMSTSQISSITQLSIEEVEKL